MKKKLKILVFGMAIIAATTVLIIFCITHCNTDLVAFLKENHDVQISRIEISGRFDGEQRTVVLTNSATLGYLSERFRNADGDGKPGYVYDAKVSLGNGKEYSFPLNIPKGGRNLTGVIKEDWTVIQDPEHYGITLIAPLPTDLAEALEKLTSPDYMQQEQPAKR